MVELRPYQKTLVAEIRNAFRTHARVVAVAPTGAGKTVVFSYVTTGAVSKNNLVLIAVHRKRIVQQISKALEQFGMRHGLVLPGHSLTADLVQVGMIQTISRRLDKLTEPNLIVFDETHHAVCKMYLDVIERWPNAKLLGVTATPQRLDGTGLGRIFTALVEGPKVRDLINDGYLADYTYLAPPQKADFSQVKKRLGDYAVDELAAVMDKATITGDVIQHYKEHLPGKTAVAFCVTVEHARHVAAQFCEAGIPAAAMDGNTPDAIRDATFARLASGDLKIVSSCELISEGVDIPAVNGALLLRPTQSLAMHLQQCGRVLRPKPDGSKAIILDHVGNVNQPGFGLPDAPRQWTLSDKKKKPKTPGVVTCDECFRVFDASAPNWRDDQECACSEPPADCVLLAQSKEGGGRGNLEHVAGSLSVVSSRPAWANGADLLLARGLEWHALLNAADTKEKLREIASARGYSPKWVYFILRSRTGNASPQRRAGSGFGAA